MNFSRVPAKIQKPFKFEFSWFLHEELFKIVAEVWHMKFPGKCLEEQWLNRASFLRKKLKGWHLNQQSITRKRKKELSVQIDELDRRCEMFGLDASNRNLKYDLEHEFNKISREEEISWFQRSKEQDLLEGDNNTAYFIARASGRKRRTKILSFNQEEGVITGDQQLLSYATKFYISLFGPSDSLNITLSEPMDCVLDSSDQQMLDAEFTLQEIKHAVFSMRRNRAPGPDGFPIEFYQKFWPLSCKDLLKLFQAFDQGALDLSRFNYGTITLLPKGVGADKIQMYRPICLSDTIFKIFTKVVNNKTMVVGDKGVDPVQSAFIKGRFILDDVVLLHETLYDIHKNKSSAVLF